MYASFNVLLCRNRVPLHAMLQEAQVLAHDESVQRRVRVRLSGSAMRMCCLQATYAPVDHINSWKENQKSPYFSKSDKHIINHPGEVRARQSDVVEPLCM